jgi:endonuclease/exonuclease/phosphatase family metal-dependent hydrolase
MATALPPLHDPTTPLKVREEMLALRTALDTQIPPKRDVNRNLLIATWNIRAFGRVNPSWTSKTGESPQRDWRAMWAIADIISRFDVVAVQEVKGDLEALRILLKTLGSNWSFLMTDVTRGTAGNSERMAFVFDTRRISLSGLAGELVIPEEQLAAIGADALKKQFARTPYAVSFRAGKETFVMITTHVLYGSKANERIPELKAIGQWLADWAKDMNDYEQNLILLGDFNIDRKGDALWQAFTSAGLSVPQELDQVPRSIFADPKKPLEKYYDQIAWFVKAGKTQLSMQYQNAGGFDFTPFLYQKEDISRLSVSHRMSDHFPLWAEFLTQK